MKLRKNFIFFILVVLLFLSSCQAVPDVVVEINKDDNTSISYNGVEYIEHEYDFSDSFRPFLCDYSLSEFEYNLIKKDVYFIDETFIADKRDVNQNFLYAYSGILGNVVYARKGFVTPELSNDYEKIDYVLVVYYDEDNDAKSEKQIINDSEQISSILSFFESPENSETTESDNIPADNKEIYICAVSGYYGGEFSVEPENVYFSNGELIAVTDDKPYKAPAEVNEIFQNTNRTEYEWGTQIISIW